MFGKFSEESQKILTLAKEEMNDLCHPYVGSEHLMLAILKNNNRVSKKLKDYKVTYKLFKEELILAVGKGREKSKWFLYTPLLKRVLENSVAYSKENKCDVSVNSLFLSLLEEGEGVAIRILLSFNLDLEELYNYFKNDVNTKKNNKKLYLKSIATNLNEMSENMDPVIGREEEIKRVMEVLVRKNKNNPILIGEAGVGKTAIVEELARLINNNEVPDALKNKKIYSIDMASAVAGTKYRGEFEDKLKNIIDESIKDENIILFVDEVHTIVGAGGAEGAIDASNILKPFLARGNLRMIGATTLEEYKKYIEKDAALDRRFQKIIVSEPDTKKLKHILMNVKKVYENYHNVQISEKIIDKIIELSNKYIHDRFEPDKSLDILDEVCALVSLKELSIEKKLKNLKSDFNETKKLKSKYLYDKKYKDACDIKDKEEKLKEKIVLLTEKVKENERKKVLIQDVIKIVSKRTNMPIYEVNNNYKKQISIMKKSLYENVIGQDIAIKKLLDITKKIKLGIKENDKCYSLLFYGPTGVGKTFLAKKFAENLVGKKNVIKLDMSEYIEANSINKLIGTPAGYVGYDDQKNVFEKIRTNPFSVLILDEVEKCSRSVLNLFLNILDEGKCTLSNGKEIFFNNVVIIMTSNAVSSKKLMGFNNLSKNNLNEFFSKEFINRIDELVEFSPLNEESIKKIINKTVENYSGDFKVKVNDIIKESNYEEYGARKLTKLIKKQIENNIIYNMS